MYSRTFSTTICLFWLVSMTWLVSEKVWPSLRTGQPPNYLTILEAQRQTPFVGWRLAFNNAELGWALCETKQQTNGMTEICSRVHFTQLPLAELTSVMSRVFKHIADTAQQNISLDTQSTLQIDPLGKLVRFDAVIRTNIIPDPVRIQGIVEGSQIGISLDYKDFTTKTEVFLPQNAILGDALSPQSELPNLREGQTWTAPSFSLFRTAGSPLDVRIATVESHEIISWNDQFFDTWLVVFRKAPGRGMNNSQNSPEKLWVTEDGKVLKQQTMIFDSTMIFTRMNELEVEKLVRDIKNAEMEEDQRIKLLLEAEGDSSTEP
jgi:hypothetical protein